MPCPTCAGRRCRLYSKARTRKTCQCECHYRDRRRWASPPDVLGDLIEKFRAGNPHARVWSTHPDPNELEDLPACEELSEMFRDFLQGKGLKAEVVEADGAEHPWAGYHRFVRVFMADGPVNVDWTARQFRNLDHPRNPRHAEQTETVPLIWTGPACRHPVTDLRYCTEKVVP